MKFVQIMIIMEIQQIAPVNYVQPNVLNVFLLVIVLFVKMVFICTKELAVRYVLKDFTKLILLIINVIHVKKTVEIVIKLTHNFVHLALTIDFLEISFVKFVKIFQDSKQTLHYLFYMIIVLISVEMVLEFSLTNKNAMMEITKMVMDVILDVK